MLRVSKIIDYGTLILTYMAQHAGQRFSAADLAAVLGLGPATVSKVLKALGQHGLVTSTRGVRGGYELARAAEQISVAEIIDALDDQPFGLTECTATPGICNVESGCHVRVNWQRINLRIRETLEGFSVADMMHPASREFPLSAPARAGQGSTIHWSLPK